MRTLFKFDPAQGKVVEAHKVWQEAKPGHYVIDDTIPMTKSPINGKLYFESKSALRAHYKQHGFEEVGTSYEHGVDPWDTYQRDTERATDNRIKQTLIERYYANRR